MRPLARAVLLGMLATQAVHGQAPERSVRSRAPYRGGVDLVMLNVTVTDAHHRYVTSLDERDFVVLEDGRPQEVAFFAHAGIPLTVALAIDTSGSMDDALGAAQEAAAAFVQRLGEGDRAAMIHVDNNE